MCVYVCLWVCCLTVDSCEGKHNNITWSRAYRRRIFIAIWKWNAFVLMWALWTTGPVCFLMRACVLVRDLYLKLTQIIHHLLRSCRVKCAILLVSSHPIHVLIIIFTHSHWNVPRRDYYPTMSFHHVGSTVTYSVSQAVIAVGEPLFIIHLAKIEQLSITGESLMKFYYFGWENCTKSHFDWKKCKEEMHLCFLRARRNWQVKRAYMWADGCNMNRFLGRIKADWTGRRSRKDWAEDWFRWREWVSGE